MNRLTCKQIAHAWGIQPTKATQARDPAFYKVAACLLEYPAETQAELAAYTAQLKRQWALNGRGPIRDAWRAYSAHHP